MTKILKEWADWYVSCAGGDIPQEAQAAYDAIGEVEALRAANNSVRDYFAEKAGDPPSAFVTAYREAIPMGRIRYTYGNQDNDGSARRHDLKVIAEYQAKLRAAWAYTFADAMLEARNVR